MRVRLKGWIDSLWLILCLLSLGAAAGATPLVLTSDPPGATVSVNGQDMGVTPLTLTVADTFVGAARVEFALEGYVPLIVEVVINPGQQITLKGVLSRVEEVGRPGSATLAPALSPTQPSGAALERIRQAVVAFRADCGAWPAVLSDVCAPGPESLSRLFNDAGETIARDGYRGPYLDSLPIDPATGGVDWVYDSATGRVTSRAATPADATMPPAAYGSGSITLEEWVALLVQATGVMALSEAPAPSVRPGPSVNGGPRGLSPPGLVEQTPTGPVLDWRPVGGQGPQ